MDETKPERRGPDRRKADRRTAASYAGPERRLSERRTGSDRRKSPRLYATPPEAFE